MLAAGTSGQADVRAALPNTRSVKDSKFVSSWISFFSRIALDSSRRFSSVPYYLVPVPAEPHCATAEALTEGSGVRVVRAPGDTPPSRPPACGADGPGSRWGRSRAGR